MVPVLLCGCDRSWLRLRANELLRESFSRFSVSSCSFSLLMPPRPGEDEERSIGLLFALTTSWILCLLDGVWVP